MGTFYVRPSRNAQYYFVLTAQNGQTILQSETYVSKAGALGGIASVKTNAPFDDRYERRSNVYRQFFFVLKAANGEVIGNSEMYSTATARDNGIASVKSNAPSANVIDQTMF